MQINSSRILGIKDIAIMTVVASLGIRWIPIAAGMGPVSLSFWLLGALLFFLPLAFIVSELSRLRPEEGGIFAWTQQSLGAHAGFIIAWLYWVNNVFYYPGALTFLASNLSYAIGRPELANSQSFVTIVVLATFWSMIAATSYGIKTNQWLSRLGGVFGIVIPMGTLIALGFIGLFVFKHSATSFAPTNFLPHHNLIGNLSSLSILMFAMAGVEVIPTLANSVRDPSKTLPRGLMIASIIIFVIYALSTLAMNLIAAPETLAKTTGTMQALTIVTAKFHVSWLTQWLAGLLVIQEYAALSIWLVVPVVMFFNCTPKGILPDKLHEKNSHDMPRNAMIFQGVLVTIIMLVTNFLPSVNAMYEVLVLMSTVLYFIPYLILVVAYLKIRKTSAPVFLNKPMYWTAAILTFVSVLFGIALSFVPTSDLTTHHAVIIYETELILGPVIFILAGFLLYRWRKPTYV
jgi:amino acid transporter